MDRSRSTAQSEPATGEAHCDGGRAHHLAAMDDLARLGLIDERDIVLDETALTLALLDHQGTDLAPYEDLLAAIFSRLEEVGADASSAAERADRLSQILSGEYGFAGDRDTYDDPDNADLLRVLDRRRGLPVSLSILYVAAARRVGWTADVLDLPGHVLVGVAALLAAAGSAPAAVRHVATMPNRAILLRLLLNQATRAEAAGRGRRALALYRRMTVFAPEHAHPWWERARLELVDGDVDAARDSLTAMLEITREPELRERITATLASLSPD